MPAGGAAPPAAWPVGASGADVALAALCSAAGLGAPAPGMLWPHQQRFPPPPPGSPPDGTPAALMMQGGRREPCPAPVLEPPSGSRAKLVVAAVPPSTSEGPAAQRAPTQVESVHGGSSDSSDMAVKVVQVDAGCMIAEHSTVQQEAQELRQQQPQRAETPDLPPSPMPSPVRMPQQEKQQPTAQQEQQQEPAAPAAPDLLQEAPASRSLLASLFVGRAQLQSGLAAVERVLLGTLGCWLLPLGRPLNRHGTARSACPPTFPTSTCRLPPAPIPQTTAPAPVCCRAHSSASTLAAAPTCCAPSPAPP